MHRLPLLALAVSLLLLPLARVEAGPVAPLARLSSAAVAPPAKVVKYVCGMFDGRFTCKSESGEVETGGKGAVPKIRPAPSSEEAPGGTGSQAMPPADQGAAACQQGMVGTPPGCRCPESSELLGGNCVHYTARCNVAPEPCPGSEEKLVCKLRPDGQRSCCCLTYDE